MFEMMLVSMSSFVVLKGGFAWERRCWCFLLFCRLFSVVWSLWWWCPFLVHLQILVDSFDFFHSWLLFWLFACRDLVEDTTIVEKFLEEEVLEESKREKILGIIKGMGRLLWLLAYNFEMVFQFSGMSCTWIFFLLEKQLLVLFQSIMSSEVSYCPR